MRVARSLSEGELACVRATILGGAPASGMIAVFDALLADVGSTVAAEGDRLVPTEFAIPHGQWLAVVGWLFEALPASSARSEALLMWVSVGPLSFSGS